MPATTLDPTQAVVDPFGPQSLQVQRNRALADAMLKMAMGGGPQGQMVSGHFVAPSPIAALLPALQAYMGSKLQGDADTQQADISKQYQNTQSQALQNYMTMRNGQPPGPGQEGNNPSAFTPGAPAVPGNPRLAAMAGIASPYPALQNVGKADLEQVNKSTLTPQDILSNQGIDVKSALAAILANPGGAPDVSKVAPRPEIRTAGDRIFNVAPGGPATDAGGITYNPVGKVGESNGQPILGQSSQNSGEVKFAPPGTNISLNTTETAANSVAKELGTESAKNLVTARADAEKAVPLMQNLQVAREALDAGMKTGAASDVQMAVAKVGKSLGLSDDPAITNTERYKVSVAQTVLQNIKALGSGTGVSDKDLEFAQKAVGASTTLDARTLDYVLKMNQVAAANKVLEYQGKLKNMNGVPGATPELLQSMQLPFEFKMPDDVKIGADGRFHVPPAGFTAPSHGAASPGAPAASGTVSFDDFVKG